MNKPVPNSYQIEMAKRFMPYLAEIEKDGLDDVLAENDDAFEWWDNIVAMEYDNQDGKYADATNWLPANEKLFIECQDWAKDFIEEIIHG